MKCASSKSTEIIKAIGTNNSVVIKAHNIGESKGMILDASMENPSMRLGDLMKIVIQSASVEAKQSVRLIKVPPSR
jgi:hypothetical protein